VTYVVQNIHRDVKRREIEIIVAKYFEGFTITSTTDFWQLQRERAIVIDIVEYGEEVIECNRKVKALSGN